jgi:hypothetical protein
MYALRTKITTSTMMTRSRTSCQVGKLIIFNSCFTSARKILIFTGHVGLFIFSGSCESMGTTDALPFSVRDAPFRHTRRTTLKPLQISFELSDGQSRVLLRQAGSDRGQ